MDGELRLHLSEEGADAERVIMLTGYLRAEPLPLDVVEDVSVSSWRAPAGCTRVWRRRCWCVADRSWSVGCGLRSAVPVIRDRLRPGEDTGRAVRLEVGGGALELSQASAAEQERLIESFIRRHAAEETGS